MSNLNFCTECKNLLQPTTYTGQLKFKCICGKTYDSTPEQTLRAEENLNAAVSNQKYITMIENSPHDLAGQKVAIECKKCYIPFLTLCYISNACVPIYICSCGAKYSASELDLSNL
jgi:DNA-directed RNA polymerase subunit M/transcription elongation factor TFIIS